VDKGINLVNGSSTSGGSSYIAANLKKPDGEIYVVISGAQYKSDEKVVMVDILEKTIMEDDLIKVNADEMLKGIKATGKVALYGIFFDFDKADIKPESKPALDEIVKMLRENPTMNLYIVGHTDMQGSLSYNMSLSERRAKAIVDELVKNYRISASRLTGAGVGPLAPVSTNKTDAGRKLNRRVELVEK
jgi:outer membrane protein OmpA-like peptidoglycan-associated protein